MSGLNSFMFGRGTSNQRFEACWSYLRRQGINRWIIKLKDLQDTFKYNALNPVHIQYVRFCLMNVLQADLTALQNTRIYTISYLRKV